MPKTKEEKFWSSNFGKNYLNRNTFSNSELDNLYINYFGISRSRLNRDFLGKLDIKNILEVGCNIGNQLALLQSQGFKDLYGIEIFPEAVERAKTHTKDINIIKASAFEIPFRDNYFDLVFTSGVLIHVNPRDLKKAMSEIYRTSKKYIWGYEYYNPKFTAIKYQKNKDRLWKGDYCQLYLDLFPNLRLVKKKELRYKDSKNIDSIFLLKKI